MTTTTPEQTRKLALTNWLAATLQEPINQEQLVPLSGDAGFRRYFRFADGRPLLAVDAPPATEDTAQFLAIGELLRHQRLRTPKVIAADASLGFLLVEDFGDQLFNGALTATNETQLYQQALQDLQQLQLCPDQSQLIPRYDQALLRRELEIFNDWFVGQMLGYSLNSVEQQQLNSLFKLLEESALAQPQCLVHRDYHSRNLLLCGDGQLGIIDFQGALWGAMTYDLASLLRDCYKRLAVTQRDELVQHFYQSCRTAGQLEGVDMAQFKRWFDWMGLQRHIKVLGIFARLYLRDGKPGYLKDLPLVIRYTLEVADNYPELQAFAHWFKSQLLPLAEQQPWYSNYQLAGE